MNISIKLFLLLINVVGVYSYNTPLFKFNNNNSNNKGGSNICVLNNNNVYRSFYKWSNENK